MKIVCLGRNLGMGGMERQLAGLAALLQRQGHQVTLLTYRSDEDFFGQNLSDAGVERARLLKKTGDTALGYIKRLADFFRQQKPDVVISYGQGASRKASAAHIFWPHFRLIVSERTANPRINPFDLYKMLLYRSAAQVIMTNSYAQAALLSRAFPWIGPKLTVVPNYVDVSLFAPSARGKDERQRFTIVTTSRVAPRKNVLRYIRAVRLALDRGADFQAIWYGRRVDSRKYCQKCDRLIKKLNLQDRFILLDAVVNPESVYGQADAFCLPSHYEGTSNSLAEAMSCGLPIICSDVGDNVRYVSRVNGYVFNSKDVESIAAAIVKIAGTPAEVLNKMKKESRETVSRELSIGAFSKHILSLL